MSCWMQGPRLGNPKLPTDQTACAKTAHAKSARAFRSGFLHRLSVSYCCGLLSSQLPLPHLPAAHTRFPAPLIDGDVQQIDDLIAAAP